MPKAASTVKSQGEVQSDRNTPYPAFTREGDASIAKVKAGGRKISTRDPRQSHLYTDDNPSTTLHGTGFKDAETAYRTIDLVSQRSITYQWQVINTMYHRAKGHPSMKKAGGVEGIKAAMEILGTWLEDTYPKAKLCRQAEGRDFKPLLKKETVAKYLTRIRALEPLGHSTDFQQNLVDCKRFAEMYAVLPKGKRLANVLLDDSHPEKNDWEIRREDALVLLREQRQGEGEGDLWNEGGGASDFHVQCIGWAWSPVGERRLPP